MAKIIKLEKPFVDLMRRVVLIVLLLTMIASTVQASTEMFLESNKNNISIGEQFEVQVIVKPDIDIDTVAIDKMSWDSDVLEFLGMTQGNLFSCSLVWIKGSANGGNYAGMCWACGTPTSTQGILATFTFEALTNGTSAISLDEVGIVRAGEPIHPVIRNCSIAVGSVFKPQDATSKQSKTIEIPIYFIASILIVVIVIVGVILYKRRVKFPQYPKDPNK